MAEGQALRRLLWQGDYLSVSAFTVYAQYSNLCYVYVSCAGLGVCGGRQGRVGQPLLIALMADGWISCGSEPAPAGTSSTLGIKQRVDTILTRRKALICMTCICAKHQLLSCCLRFFCVKSALATSHACRRRIATCGCVQWCRPAGLLATRLVGPGQPAIAGVI